MTVAKRPATACLARWWAVALVCALVLASFPFLAHQTDCHLKPRTDCSACVSSAAAARVPARVTVERALLLVATLEVAAEHCGHGGAPLVLAGRAPPA